MAKTGTPFPLRFLRRRDVEEVTGLAKSTIYMYMEQGTFPKPIRIGEKASVMWLEHEVVAWMHEQIDNTRGTAAHA
ncbi:AlpA family phage regulatory protein [Pseudomonas sp. JS3066]|uniref:helix-turn-helix transcriptional regulator n=1 Tax=Pseudomonas sp. JS3066 TaxID=3090665 RepID=UPI002E7AD1DD|nr:AlpA family phage regulatory protein [Pseudomonas sp. JS3066]WVK92026.1 AlpA family phage regulatory protein [Pseudomonas sp. JS3066]